MKITNVKKFYERKRRTPAFLIVLIEDKLRPINFGNIEEDFSWRRTISYSSLEKNDELLFLASQFLGVGKDEIKIKFNRNAGCSMCPCSPGLFVYINNESRWYYDYLSLIWVEM